MDSLELPTFGVCMREGRLKNSHDLCDCYVSDRTAPTVQRTGHDGAWTVPHDCCARRRLQLP